MNPQQIASLIKQEISKALRTITDQTFYRGEITAVSGKTASVQIEGGGGSVPNILCIGSYVPVVGHRVLLISIGKTGSNFLILGRLDGLVPDLLTYIIDEDDFASDSDQKIPTQQSTKAYILSRGTRHKIVTGSQTSNASAGYVPRALATPCTLTVPVVSGAKYLLEASCTYFLPNATTGEADFGIGIGTTPIIAGTFGAHTNTYGLPARARYPYTAVSTGNVTFQVIVASAAAAGIRTDNVVLTCTPLIT